jgi:hypothetical protein
VSSTAQAPGTIVSSASVQGENDTSNIKIQNGGARNLKKLTQNINKINRIFENQ